MRNSIMLSIPLLMVCSAAYALPGKDRPVSGKMYFSNEPFAISNAGNKKSFRSDEFIYGRLELDGQTVKQAFRISDKNMGRTHSFLFYTITILNNGQEISSNVNGSLKKILLQDKDKQNHWLNFDVLPEPVKASTVLLSSEKLNASRSTVPFYRLIGEENFKENGEYKVVLKLFSQTYDTSGSMEPESKWTRFEGDFNFNFNVKDVVLIKKNEKEADAIIQETVFDLSKLPAVFSNPATTIDTNLSAANISTILKRDMSHWSVVKFALSSYHQDSLWQIEKDKYGQYIQKYVVPKLWIAYKIGDKCFVDYVQIVQLAEKNFGKGGYGPLQVKYSSPLGFRKSETINCSKIN